jgi:hypothetical protein
MLLYMEFVLVHAFTSLMQMKRSSGTETWHFRQTWKHTKRGPAVLDPADEEAETGKELHYVNVQEYTQYTAYLLLTKRRRKEVTAVQLLDEHDMSTISDHVQCS